MAITTRRCPKPGKEAGDGGGEVGSDEGGGVYGSS